MNTINTENSKNMPITGNPFSFWAGWKRVPRFQVNEMREKIMAALSITTTQNFYMRLRGDVEPRVSEAKAIEEIFQQYGITEIWGE